MKKLKGHNKAFALLFSIVVISVIITTTLAVSALVRRGLDMAAIGERSMRAFFAASSGLECALFWDIRQRRTEEPNAGASPFRRGTQNSFLTHPQMTCFGQNVTVHTHATLQNTRWFEINHQGVCTRVEVQLLGTDLMRTEARSSGFSGTCPPGPGVIERGLDAEY